MDPGRYALFVETVARGSITAAADALQVSRPTLSRQIAALEQELGVALLHRSTRHVKPTAAGRRLFEQVRPLLEALGRVEADLAEERDEVAGLLRVSVPPVIASDVGGLLIALQREHPRLSVELLADIRWADLRADGVDVALRAGRIADKELIQRRLTAREVYAMASPGYLARQGTPTTARELAAHRLLRGQGPDGVPQRWWPLRSGGRVPVEGAFVCNDQRALQDVAEGGGGIALLDAWSAAQPLAEGRLVRVMAKQVGATLRLHAVFTRRTLRSARVRAFVDAAVRWYAAKGADDERA